MLSIDKYHRLSFTRSNSRNTKKNRSHDTAQSPLSEMKIITYTNLQELLQRSYTENITGTQDDFEQILNFNTFLYDHKS